jgi:hypothetical protein
MVASLETELGAALWAKAISSARSIKYASIGAMRAYPAAKSAPLAASDRLTPTTATAAISISARPWRVGLRASSRTKEVIFRVKAAIERLLRVGKAVEQPALTG